VTLAKLTELTAQPGDSVWQALLVLPGRRQKINRTWLETQLTPSQLQFLDRSNADYRPHPRSSKTQTVVEVFVAKHSLNQRDLNWAVLLFGTVHSSAAKSSTVIAQPSSN
jgi:hypothetical protein